MSFLAGNSGKAPAQQQKPLGTYADRMATNEQARPVPWFCGKQRLGLTFISDVFEQVATGVDQSVGKQKTRTGYNYYTSFAAVACIGTVDGLHDIFFNGEPVYASETQVVIAEVSFVGLVVTCRTSSAHTLVTGDAVIMDGISPDEYNGSFIITVTDATHFTYALPSSPSASPASTSSSITARLVLDPVYRDVSHPDYVDIVIPGFGEMRLYWGTETQEPDEYLQTSGVQHPAYRGLCYVVFNRLFLGFNQTNVQNIEFVLSRNPSQSWHSLGSIEQESNLVTAVADAFQNPRCGLALPDSRFNAEELLVTGEQIRIEGVGFSPLVSRTQEARQAFTLMLEYLDAYPTLDADSKIGLKLARNDAAVVDIDDDDMTTKPTLSTEDWSTTFDETTVKFTNRDYSYTDGASRHRDPACAQIVQEPSARTIERPWFTRQSVADAFALSLGLAGALPEITGRVKLRDTGTLFNQLVPGALFTMDYSRRDFSGMKFRVVDRVRGSATVPEFEISFKVDRSYLFNPASISDASGIAGSDSGIFGSEGGIF